ncbi:MAG: hypothetical protein AB8G77_08710 [Rhodothermales bacterium]
MGQQQLLLLVLGIVLVMVAVVAGLMIFEDNIKKSNSESLISDAVNIATSAQSWKVRPTAFGGQQGQYRDDPMDYTGFDFNSISLPTPHITANGAFTFTADARGLVIIGQNEDHGNQVTLTVDGLTERDIIAVVSNFDETLNITSQ